MQSNWSSGVSISYALPMIKVDVSHLVYLYQVFINCCAKFVCVCVQICMSISLVTILVFDCTRVAISTIYGECSLRELLHTLKTRDFSRSNYHKSI